MPRKVLRILTNNILTRVKSGLSICTDGLLFYSNKLAITTDDEGKQYYKNKFIPALAEYISRTLNILGWSGNRSLDSVGTDDRKVYGGGFVTGTADPLKIINTGIQAGDTLQAIDGGNVGSNVAGEIVFADGVEYGAFEVLRSGIVIARYWLSGGAYSLVASNFTGANALDNGTLSGVNVEDQRGYSANYSNDVDENGGRIADGTTDYTDNMQTSLYPAGFVIPADSENPTKAKSWDGAGVQKDLQFSGDAKLSLEISESPSYQTTTGNSIDFGTSIGNLTNDWAIVLKFKNFTTSTTKLPTFLGKTDGGVGEGQWLIYNNTTPDIVFLYNSLNGPTSSLILPNPDILDELGKTDEMLLLLDYKLSTGKLRFKIGNVSAEKTESNLDLTSAINFSLNKFGGASSGTETNANYSCLSIMNRSLTDDEFNNPTSIIVDKSSRDFHVVFSADKKECYDTVGGGVYAYLGVTTGNNSVMRACNAEYNENGFNVYSDGAIAPKTDSGGDITRSGHTISSTYSSFTGINKVLDSIYKYALPKSKRLLTAVASFFTNGQPNKYTGAQLKTAVDGEAKASITELGNELSELNIQK